MDADNINMRKVNKKGQVWIETVIYTLIGLTIIGLLLAFARPKIEAIRDKAIIDQTVEALTSIDKTLSDVVVAPGNVRLVVFNLKKGEMTISPINDTIEIKITGTKIAYSEPGKIITQAKLSIGQLKVLTESKGEVNDIKIWLDYSGVLDLSYNKQTKAEVFQQATLPYKFLFSNEGNPKIDIGLAGG